VRGGGRDVEKKMRIDCIEEEEEEEGGGAMAVWTPMHIFLT
jgi:hypothetical protein